jgi:hypothetical protein
MAYGFGGEKLDLQGMTGEEINKTLSEYFSKVGDVAVRTLFGDLVTQYQKLNEGLFETAARLVIDKAIVSEIIAMTNQGLPGTTAQIIAFSESLIELAGGLDILQESAAIWSRGWTSIRWRGRRRMLLSFPSPRRRISITPRWRMSETRKVI